MNELQFQKELVDAARKAGGYGLKMTNQFTAGVPDLLIKLKWYPACIIECKLLPGSAYDRNYGPCRTTSLQKDTLRKMKYAHMTVGVVILIDHKWPQKIVIVEDIQSTRFNENDTFLYRKRGEAWPIEKIVKILNAPRENSDGT